MKKSYEAVLAMDAPAPNLEILLTAHDSWELGQDIVLPAVKVAAVTLQPDLQKFLARGLGVVSYGLVGDYNRQHANRFTPQEEADIADRNQNVGDSLAKINELSRQFLSLVQADAEDLQYSHIMGWDLFVRGGRYDERAREISNNLHIDGGPPILRYVAGLLGATTGFADEVTVNRSQVSERGVLFDPTRDVSYIETGDTQRFSALTPHIAPPLDGDPRLFMSATAWLDPTYR
jgi:hypothetical protein